MSFQRDFDDKEAELRWSVTDMSVIGGECLGCALSWTLVFTNTSKALMLEDQIVPLRRKRDLPPMPLRRAIACWRSLPRLWWRAVDSFVSVHMTRTNYATAVKANRYFDNQCSKSPHLTLPSSVRPLLLNPCVQNSRITRTLLEDLRRLEEQQVVYVVAWTRHCSGAVPLLK